MSDLEFERLARRIVWLTLASAGLSGCGGSARPPGTVTGANEPQGAISDPPTSESAAPPNVASTPESTTPESTPQGEACLPSGQRSVLAGLHPAVPVDYLGMLMPGDKNTLLESVGTPCASAKDPAQCKAALAALKSDARFPNTGSPFDPGRQIIYTRGDDVGLLTTTADLKEFLGPIDTVGEAILWVWADGYFMESCSESESNAKQTADGFELTTKKTVTFCQPIASYRFKLNVKPDGAVNVLSKTLESSSPACVGRQSAGVVRSANADADPRGKYFADCAQLERAAVIAFERLSRELAALGAPLELLRDAERARQDEVRHTATMGKLAAHFDTAVGEVRVEDVPLRSAFEVALENAVEGCVRESFAALVGLWQSERASADLRQALREIAVDELRHAALSWRVARWLEPRLSDEERGQVERARKLAFNELSTETQDLSGALNGELGIPNAAEAHELVRRLGAQLGLT